MNHILLSVTFALNTKFLSGTVTKTTYWIIYIIVNLFTGAWQIFVTFNLIIQNLERVSSYLLLIASVIYIWFYFFIILIFQMWKRRKKVLFRGFLHYIQVDLKYITKNLNSQIESQSSRS